MSVVGRGSRITYVLSGAASFAIDVVTLGQKNAPSRGLAQVRGSARI